MSERKIPGSVYDSEVKNRILDESTKLFALNGFGSVSMRDIGKAADIQIATIYYYFNNKETLFEEIMQRFENGYRHYFEWLQAENLKANTLDEFMDNMFNKEFLEMTDITGCLGMSLALKEQHSSQSARKRVFDLFLEHSITCLKSDFDSLIEKGIIPPSDTQTIAEFFMHSVMIINDIGLHDYFGHKPPANHAEMHQRLKKHITFSLLQGNNDN